MSLLIYLEIKKYISPCLLDSDACFMLFQQMSSSAFHGFLLFNRQELMDYFITKSSDVIQPVSQFPLF